jgi:hypothetical protein
METSNKLTGEPLNDLTLFAVDTLVSHLALQRETDAEPMTHDICGLGLETPLAIYDPNTQSWKTSGDICLWGEQPSLESLPKSGMTRNGVLYQQPAWVPIIDGTELSLWPTPTAVTRPMEGNVRLYRAKVQAGEMTETEAQALLGKSVWEAQGKIPARWPTPVARGGLDGGSHSRATMKKLQNTPAEVPSTGKMNPQWVEWLMGFPIGWTDLED